MSAAAAPVIAIDGPTASGKGTIAQGVARRLGFNYLDSGSLYRLVSLKAQAAGVALDDEAALAAIASGLRPEFLDDRIMLDGQDVTDLIRQESVGAAASRLAVLPGVRRALVQAQHGFRTAPGLVADGRDMGTAIFPDAKLKIFLTADVQSRADRRHKQLIEKGFSSNITGLLEVLRERDKRDANRAVSPLKAAEDSVVIDSTHLTIDQTIEQVLGAWQAVTAARSAGNSGGSSASSSSASSDSARSSAASSSNSAGSNSAGGGAAGSGAAGSGAAGSSG